MRVRVPEGEEKEGRPEKALKEIMAENFLNLPSVHTHTHKHTHTPIQNQDAEQNPNRISSKKSTPRHIIVNIMKTKDKEKTCESSNTEMAFYLQRKVYLNDSGFLIRNPSRSHEGATEHSSIVEREKGLSIQHTISSENSSKTKRKSRHSQIKES